MTLQLSRNNKIDGTDEDEEPLHVHDLPQLYTRPSADGLLSTLHCLASTPTAFSEYSAKPHYVSSSGLARYLTQIVSSSLSWLDEASRESIWELASTRLAERSGRSAAPAMTRRFEVDHELTITLHEPTLTEDNLGLKTWSSSLVLARKLQELEHLLPPTPMGEELCVLELGSGTGLVGIAAACKWSSQRRTTHVTLSDLSEIVPNLEKNVESNEDIVASCHGRMSVCTLDWADELKRPLKKADTFPVIVAADPFYSPEHPELLVGTVGRWLARSAFARFVVAFPLRDGYTGERFDMMQRLLDVGFVIEKQGEEQGFDDWEGADGQRQEVKYSWSVWKGTRKWCKREISTPDEELNQLQT